MSDNHDSHGDHHDHHNPGFIKKYIFSTDHKTIGLQYGLTAMLFLLFGFYLMMVMRWSIAYPNEPLPAWMSWLFTEDWKAQWLTEGKLPGETYNMFGAMHGTIMVFLGIVPLGFGAFGNYVTPLQIGAPDMAFPKLNMVSYYLYVIGGVMMCASFFMESGAAKSGWTNYPPLSFFADAQYPHQFWTGQTQWLMGLVMLISSSLLGSVNFIITIINLRAKGMTWMRMPCATGTSDITMRNPPPAPEKRQPLTCGASSYLATNARSCAVFSASLPRYGSTVWGSIALHAAMVSDMALPSFAASMSRMASHAALNNLTLPTKSNHGRMV